MKSKKAIIAVVLFISCLISFGISKNLNKTPPPDSQLDDKLKLIELEPELPSIPPIVKKINERNSKYQTLRAKDIDFRIWEDGFNSKLSGSINYEKDMKFRMFVNSVLGNELDLGSNENEFWFWSRRSNRRGLYWAKHEDYNRTRLKTPFNPIFIKSAFGIDPIPTKDAKYIENEKGLLVMTNGTNSMGKKINKYIYINKETEFIEAHLITYQNGLKSASAEVISHDSNGMPQKIIFNYYEENKVMQLNVKNLEKNVVIEESMWKKPDISPEINMGEQLAKYSELKQ